jgi:ferredoxin
MRSATILALVFAAAATALAVIVVRGYLKFRGTRIVTCPVTRDTVAVEVDAAHAALTAPIRPDLRLTACTLWPERAHCGQTCLDQIEAAPESCLLRSILAHWYEGKVCVLCGRVFTAVRWIDHRPALLAPDGRTVEWREIDAAGVYHVLDTHRPACWNCHVAESFRRDFPDRVLDVPAEPAPMAPRLLKPTGGTEGEMAMIATGTRLRRNAWGRYYVSDECNGCGLCESYARANFTNGPDSDYYYVVQQPADQDEEQAVVEAIENCPLHCIHDDGEAA